jgi:ABC-type antimicrobial peptide transport system permease subunit
MLVEPRLLALLFPIVLAVTILASVVSVRRIAKLDPAMVFR